MKFQTILMLSLIICVGAFFRLFDTNWDMNFHLHPDERFLTMIGLKETLPSSIGQYINPTNSPFNPSLLGFGFFVYGVLPLTINTLFAILFHTQEYNAYTLQGRIISATFDIVAILLVYATALLLQKKFHLPEKTRFFAAFFYAIAVLPIQLSHFFTVDIFLSFFVLLSTYFILYFAFYKKMWMAALAGISLGLAIACKINALALVPLDLFLLVFPFIHAKKERLQIFLALIIFSVCTYCSVRIADPYLFATGNFFDFRINADFIQSIQALTSYANPHTLYPPNIQWINKLPVIFSLFNIAFFGLGIGIFFFMIWGLWYIVKTKKIILLSLVLWVILFFLYQSTQYVKTMRYFIFLYPFFALFAGIGFGTFLTVTSRKIVLLIGILLVVIWPLSFLSIYTKPHTRVAASDWITRTIPAGSTILGEYWDDPLPLSNEKGYTIELMHVFDEENNQKWETIRTQLQAGDYLILSSNRGWGSITESKKIYPVMSKWYEDLFAGKLSYKKVAEFASFPSLSYLGIPVTFNDTIAEEAFTVYDHPVVYVFKNVSKQK